MLLQPLALSGPARTQSDTLLGATLATALVLMTIFALMAGKALLVPFAMALLLWFIINALARRLDRLFAKDGEPGLGALAAAVLIVIATCIGVAEGTAGFAGSAGTMVMYIAFLLAEQHFLGKKRKDMARDDERHAKISAVLAEIGQRVRSNLFTKSLTSAAMAVMVWVALEIAGVDFAGFWAFRVFVLNLIPVIGGIVSGVFPAALTLVQLPTLTPFLIVVAGVGIALSENGEID
ncbi:MAG: AI-2E family transporter [Pseudomonadota bacterium]